MAELSERLQAALGTAYRLEKELGGGGMSRVFVAEETRLARRVVIKVLPPELAATTLRGGSPCRGAAAQRGEGIVCGVSVIEDLASAPRPVSTMDDPSFKVALSRPK